MILLAYHEAGHAVAGHFLGGRIDYITIAQEAYGQSKGPLARVAIPGDGLARLRNQFVFLQGGDAAVAVVFGADYLAAGVEDDYRDMIDAYRAHYHTLHGCEAFRNETWSRALDLIVEHLAEVRSLAAALLEKGTVAGPEARRIIHSLSR